MSDDTPPKRADKASAKPVRRRPRCAICGEEAHQPVEFGMVRPAIAEAILADHPGLTADAAICRKHLIAYRTRYIEDMLARERGEVSDLERQVVESVAREETISRNVEAAYDDKRTLGERAADVVAEFGGSWNFIGIFAIVMAVWMGFNVWTATRAIFDPYPFILLNLVLSCLAAIQAPIIMMSQKRQETKDRLRSENDYRVNLKAELEIRNLHDKMDHLIHQQWERLAEIQQIQLEMMQDMVSPQR
jgi:uncharacterized membrane protein/ribosomal protein S14